MPSFHQRTMCNLLVFLLSSQIVLAMKTPFNPTRSKFVSSSVGSVFTSIMTLSHIAKTDDSCSASAATKIDNPRYIQREVQMTFPDKPGKVL